MRKGKTMKKTPHKISLKSLVEKKLQRIICSGKTTDQIIRDLHKAFPKLKAFEKLDLENEHHFFFMQRTIDAVQQIKHNINILKTIVGIEGDEK